MLVLILLLLSTIFLSINLGMFRRFRPANNVVSANHQTPISTAVSGAEHHPRSKSDIFHVAFLLRQVLVADLVPSIIDFAEYWVKTTDIRRERLSVQEHNAGIIYLTTTPIDSPLLYPVRRIVFKVKSHDQGWSNYPEDHGTYNNSWTWVCVSKVNDSETATMTTSDGRQNDTNSVRLFTNVHAGRGYSTHEIEWSVDSEEKEIRDFVRNLKRGDQLQIGIWARFAGWQNHIQSAQVDTYIACVR